MVSRRLRHVLRVQRIAAGLAGITFGILLSVLANWLSAQWFALFPLVLVLAVVSGAAAIYFTLWQRPDQVPVVFNPPTTIRSETDALHYARKGFVGFVPFYTPQRSSPAAKLSPEERRAAMQRFDFAALDVENSNLQPTLVAIDNHKGKLKHCWLLSTTSDKGFGSKEFAEFLVEYLRQVKHISCEYYYRERYAISLDTDAEVLKKTFDLVREVFAEAAAKGLQPEDVVVDITPGIRSMALGATLACLDAEHLIEFVGTRYDENGQPTGPLFPVLFSFEAMPD